MKTFSAKPLEVTREWFVVDATDKIVGHLAAEIATRLRGKVGNGSYTREQVQGISPVKKEQAKNSSTSGEKLYHKVKYGETLSSIAKKRGVTVEQICRLNGYKKNKVLTPGQILRYS